MLSHPIADGAAVQLGVFPTFCLEHGTNNLRVSYNAGGQLVVLNTVDQYFGREVPTSLTISEGLATVAKSKLIALEEFHPTGKEFAPMASDVSVKSNLALVSGGVMAGDLVSKAQPHYPPSAIARHVSGTVILRAIIGRDGHVHSLRPMTYPDPDLIIAALKAVRQWTYKPYLLNGQPTDIDTTITVNFNLNGH
jgi:TonB family protein